MFRKFTALLSALLIVSNTPLAAAPVISLTIVKAIPMDQDIAGMLVGDAAIYLFGNTPTGGYVTALNKDGSEKWMHSFSDLRAFTISAGALDASGAMVAGTDVDAGVDVAVGADTGAVGAAAIGGGDGLGIPLAAGAGAVGSGRRKRRIGIMPTSSASTYDSGSSCSSAVHVERSLKG